MKLLLLLLSISLSACTPNPPKKADKPETPVSSPSKESAQDIIRIYGSTTKLLVPWVGLRPEQVAVIVNTASSRSVRIGNYYQRKRGIPEENIIRVAFPDRGTTMPVKQFEMIKEMVDASTPTGIQGYALAWSTIYRVGCMSITSAFAFGYNTAYCASGCKPTKPNPYFNSDSPTPYFRHKIRPTMMLAGQSYRHVQEMIDRGISADGTAPKGTGYLLSTSDKARNSRAKFFPKIIQSLNHRINLKQLKTNSIENRQDVLFYFTGLSNVPKIDTNTFLPGAIADHLTSFGGRIDRMGGQMKILKWLEAGAAGSYGTVVEPCNFPQKFPHPGIVIDRYTRGETLIEAYWKSVLMPGQGIFVGDPLAKPYFGYKAKREGDEILIHSWNIKPHKVECAIRQIGPYHPLNSTASHQKNNDALIIRFRDPEGGYCRVVTR